VRPGHDAVDRCTGVLRKTLRRSIYLVLCRVTGAGMHESQTRCPKPLTQRIVFTMQQRIGFTMQEMPDSDIIEVLDNIHALRWRGNVNS
jgi:hypothetical protein